MAENYQVPNELVQRIENLLGQEMALKVRISDPKDTRVMKIYRDINSNGGGEVTDDGLLSLVKKYFLK